MDPSNPAFHQAAATLLDLYGRVATEPGVAARYREWRNCLARYYGRPVGDLGLFVTHTHISNVARLIGARILSPDSPPTGPEDLASVVDGTYFRERDVYNFAEDDFFTWLLHPLVAGEALSLCGGLMGTLRKWDPRRHGTGPIDSLRALMNGGDHMGSAEWTDLPAGLAERILSTELGLEDNPGASVFDPACRSGSFVGAAVRLLREAKLNGGMDAYDTLTSLTSDVAGVDGHPVHVVIARAAYLHGLGNLVREPHPPVLIPVYLANSLAPLRTSAGDGGASVHLLLDGEGGDGYAVPDSVAGDPVHLDWLFHRLPQYVHGAQIRAPGQGDTEAINSVMGPLYSYVTSPKRSGMRPLAALDTHDAHVLCDTARRIIALGLQGEGMLWLYLVKNAAAPVHLTQRRFNLVVGRTPPGTGTDQFLNQATDLYLQEDGTVAVTLQFSERVNTVPIAPVPVPGEVRVVDLTSGPCGWRLVVLRKRGVGPDGTAR